MKRVLTNKYVLSVALILLTVCLFSCTKEDRLAPVPKEEEPIVEEGKHGFHFTITVKGVSSKAGIERIEDKDKYVFREGDKLYVSDQPAGTVPSVCGELSLTSLPGQTTGTFEGDLNTDPVAGTKFYVTLLSAEDKIHTMSGTAPLKYVDTVRTFPTGSPTTPASTSGAIASTLEQAINWYSDFTGSFIYGTTNCLLSQKTSFIEFNIRYLDIATDVEFPAEQKVVTVSFTNTSDGTTLDAASCRYGRFDSFDKDPANYAYTSFFVGFPGGTTSLKNAEVNIHIGGPVFPERTFTVADVDLASSKKYRVNRDISNEFSIRTTANGTKITFDSQYYTGDRGGSDVQFMIGDGDWKSYKDNYSDLENLNKDLVVKFRAKRVTIEGEGMYDNQSYYDEKGKRRAWPANNNHPIFTFSKKVKVYGDIMSLLCDDNYSKSNHLNEHDFAGAFWKVSNMDINEGRNLVLSAQTLTTNCYQNMFRESSIVLGKHIVVSALTMGEYSCNSMFKGCSSMTSAPVLKSTTMAPYCYQSMFENCTKLAEAPELPAENLAESCYRQMLRNTGITTLPAGLFDKVKALQPLCFYSMFSACTKLTNTPNLPFTNLETNCYAYMFAGCTSLNSTSQLPATTLAKYCYHNMFSGCTSLTTTPDLPATNLADFCYRMMFSGCINLTTAPERLPATTLAKSCYCLMFNYCKKLTVAPELPATNLADSCYREMFQDCAELASAPELPATTLAIACYKAMFKRCAILKESPILPAETLPTKCYEEMFYDCLQLEVVTCLAKNHGSNSTYHWLLGVNDNPGFNNVFRYNKDLSPFAPEGWLIDNPSGIPQYWEKEPYNPIMF